MSDLSWLNPTPHAIAVYASRPLSPGVTQHSLPSGRYSLLGPDFHRLDRASFAWRTHSITSSARCCKNEGTSMPIAFAVFRLITSSNFVGCSMGKSAGLVPCNILDTNTALRLYMSDKSAPYDNSPPASTKGRNTEADGRRYLIAKSAIAF